MGKRETFLAIASGVFAVGGAAMTAVAPLVFLHRAELIFYAGLGVTAVGFAGLVLLFVWRPREDRSERRIDTPPSTTIRSRGGGSIHVEDFYSTAHTLAYVEDGESLSLKRGVHAPDSREQASDRPATRRQAIGESGESDCG